MVGSPRDSSPVIVRSGTLEVLSPLTGRESAETSPREKLIQELVHNNPSILPMADIEPAFAPLISMAMELPTEAGFLDNLWITPAGGLVIGECKLFKNPEARREVVAQALDYARAIASWDFEKLESAVRRARSTPSMKIWDFVREQTDLDEAQFVDAVERRLRTGRFLILIIGDGIREGVKTLSEYLQLHAGLHVSLALVELSLWKRVGCDELLVVPRVPMRTVLIERGIVNIAPSGAIAINAPGKGDGTFPAGRAVTISEEEFYAQLEERCRAGVQLRHYLRSLEDARVRPSFTKTSLRAEWQSGHDDQVALIATFDNSGRVWFTGVPSGAARLGKPEAAESYLSVVANLVGGTIKRYDNGSLEVVKAGGGSVDLASIMPKSAEWRTAIQEYISDMGGGRQDLAFSP